MLSKPKIYIGSKSITVHDPSWFVSCFANHVFDPIITPLKVDKEGVVFYLLQVRDNNTGKQLDVQWEIPESISGSVRLQTNEESGFDAVWETPDQESNAYKTDVNRCLEYWLKQIQHANTFGEEPEIRFLPSSTKLKWPWKTASNESYFKNFRTVANTHILKLGVGYFQSGSQIAGASMQLSSYPGKTQAALDEMRSRKRKKPEPDSPIEPIVDTE